MEGYRVHPGSGTFGRRRFLDRKGGRSSSSAIAGNDEGFWLPAQSLRGRSLLGLCDLCIAGGKQRLEIIEAIHRDAGIAMELISGSKEAELIYKAHRSLAGPEDQLVLMDVGGGSTEISLIQGQRSILSKSFALGAVRLLDQTDREHDWKAFKDFVKGELLPFKPSAFWGVGEISTRYSICYVPAKASHVPTSNWTNCMNNCCR